MDSEKNTELKLVTEIIACRRFYTNFPGKETIGKLKDCSIYNYYNTLIYRWFRMSLTLLELGRNATLIESKSHKSNNESCSKS